MGSNPIASTDSIWAAILDRVGFTLGGLVAGEGSFIITRKLPSFPNGDPRFRFVFQVRMATRDRALLEVLRSFLGVGSLHEGQSSNAAWRPHCTFVVNSLTAHHAATIPFAERFILGSAKRQQFERWRDAMLAYELAHPSRYGKGPPSCSVPGCSSRVRGRGLCRSHYYRATGY